MSDEVEDTIAESDHLTRQPENLIASQLVDQAHTGATAFPFEMKMKRNSNENDDDSFSNSLYTQRSISTSPERHYASSIDNLAKISKKVHDIIPETDLDEDDEDACNQTFTQHINQKMESDSQSVSLERTICSSPRNKLITITTKYKPPSSERILKSMTLYGIPKCRWQKPFFGNKLDLAKQKESLSANTSYFDIPVFKSSLDEITSIRLWRRMKVNEFHPSGTSIKTCHVKRTLAGCYSLTIKPLATPPSSKDMKNWVRAKKYLAEKNNVKSHKRNKEDASNIQQNMESSVDQKKELQRGTSIDSSSNNSDKKESDSLMLQQSVLSGMSDKTRRSDFTQNSDNLQTSRVSLNPSLQKILENPLLYKENKSQLGVSYGQIECLSKGSNDNPSNENLQNVRAITLVSL